MSGRDVAAPNLSVSARGPFFCPGCRELVYFRAPVDREAHFYHPPHVSPDCRYRSQQEEVADSWGDSSERDERSRVCETWAAAIAIPTALRSDVDLRKLNELSCIVAWSFAEMASHRSTPAEAANFRMMLTLPSLAYLTRLFTAATFEVLTMVRGQMLIGELIDAASQALDTLDWSAVMHRAGVVGGLAQTLARTTLLSPPLSKVPVVPLRLSMGPHRLVSGRATVRRMVHTGNMRVRIYEAAEDSARATITVVERRRHGFVAYPAIESTRAVPLYQHDVALDDTKSMVVTLKRPKARHGVLGWSFPERSAIAADSRLIPYARGYYKVTANTPNKPGRSFPNMYGSHVWDRSRVAGKISYEAALISILLKGAFAGRSRNAT